MSAETSLVRKLNAFITLSSDEVQCLNDLQSQRYTLKPETPLITEGQATQKAFLLADGWAYNYKLLANGRRQIISFPISGDILGLRSALLRTADHSAATITAAEVSKVSARRLRKIFNDLPRLGIAIFWAASREEAMIVEHLVDVGRRNALERIAHMLLELGERLKLIGRATDSGFACPLSQEFLADALGLSLVHVNRILRQLRERGLITFKSGQISIHDLRGLTNVAQFDSSYLDHPTEPELTEPRKRRLVSPLAISRGRPS